MLLLKSRPFVQSSFDMLGAPIASRFVLFFYKSLFPSIFCTIFRFLFVWTIEYVVRSFLPHGVFLSCDHGLIFYISLGEISINQSINQSIINQSIFEIRKIVRRTCYSVLFSPIKAVTITNRVTANIIFNVLCTFNRQTRPHDVHAVTAALFKEKSERA